MRYRGLYLLAAVWLGTISDVYSALISSPFDNFRIECPQNAGAQRLSVRMVESQGLKRQDTVFSISCNNVNELYPWNGMPTEIAEMERENCRYSNSFDPIMDHTGNFSCGPREYVASLVRLFGTKIQVGCCKLRTRDEINCVEQRYGKPFDLNFRTEIENRAMLINAIAVDGHFFRVRFCDLTPRAIGLIEEDAKIEVALKTTTLPITTTLSTTTTESLTEAQETETPSIATSPKKIIKVKQTFAKQRDSLNNAHTDLETLPVATIDKLDIGVVPTLQPLNTQETIPTSSISSLIDRLQESTKTDESTKSFEPLLPIHGTSIVSGISGKKPASALVGLDELASSPSSSTVVAFQDSTTENYNSTEISTTSDEESTASNISSTTIDSSSTTSSNKSDDMISTLQIETTTEFETTTSSSSVSTDETTVSVSIIESTTEKVSSHLHEGNIIQSAHSTPSSNLSITINSTESTTEIPSSSIASIIVKRVGTKANPTPSDANNTETMFPHTSTDEYDEESNDQKQIQNTENSGILKAQTTMQKLRKESEDQLSDISTNVSNSFTSSSLHEQTGGSSINIDSKSKKENATPSSTKLHEHDAKDQQFSEMISGSKSRASIDAPAVHQRRLEITEDEIKSEIAKTQAAADEPVEDEDETTTSAANVRHEPSVQKKVDEFANDAPFDFDAFPSPPPETGAVAVSSSTTSPQKSQTRRTSANQSSTTPEPDYLVADDLSEVPEAIRPHSRRKFQQLRGSSIRRRPSSALPYVDEETNGSPFDFGAENEGNSKSGNNRGRKIDSLPEEDRQIDSFDHINTFEQPSSRFSLPETRFNQQSPFDLPGEIRRAPTPHLNEAFNYNIIDKLSAKEPPRSVDIVFETPLDESTPTMPPISEIGRRDGERSYTPQYNQPMPISVPSSSIDDAADSTKTVELPISKQAVENLESQEHRSLFVAQQPSQLVPMAEPTTMSVVDINTSQPPTTEQSTTIASATFNDSTARTEIASSGELTLSSTPIYDPVRFYHTMPPRRGFFKEKVLTFCSKDSAIRDTNNMVIACGSESEIWIPNRCPIGTDCFTSHDSLYRICCPVGTR